MPNLATWLAFVVTALVLLLIPGPAVLYIVSQSVEHGRRAGLMATLGVHCGTLVHITAAALGLSAILVSSSIAFGAVRLIGAAYLIYLGIRTLADRSARAQAPDRKSTRLNSSHPSISYAVFCLKKKKQRYDRAGLGGGG